MTQNGSVLTVNGRGFTVQTLLGKGKGGYSYLVTDGAAQFVLKQLHHEPCSYYTFGDKLAAELHDYALLSEVGILMPALLDVDREHERLLKEYIPGQTVYSLIAQDALPPYCRTQVESMCALLYPRGLNIDYFPTNFIPHSGKLYYVDYECNPYLPEWDFEHWGAQYWSKTDAFRAYAAEHG